MPCHTPTRFHRPSPFSSSLVLDAVVTGEAVGDDRSSDSGETALESGIIQDPGILEDILLSHDFAPPARRRRRDRAVSSRAVFYQAGA